MTALSDMSAAGQRVLDLLTTSEVIALLPGRCSPKKVRQLGEQGELERVPFGALVRYTPESVAAYGQRRDAGVER